MKKLLLSLVPLLIAAPLVAADAKSDLSAAAKLLADKGYSWKSTVAMPEGGGGGGRGRMGPTEGKTAKGLTHVVYTMGENKMEAVVQGEKAAIKNQEGEWVSPADAGSEGPGRWMGMMARNVRLPATEAGELIQGAKQIKKEGDAYVAELTEDGAKKLMAFRRGQQQQGDGPTYSNAKGTAKFWTKDGALTKYEYHVEGSMSFNGNDRQINRTTTVEIKDVGTTKVEAPEAALKKLS